MTTRAREALADCEHALTDFEAGANTPFQRSRWVALLTLLRTVGLVLYAIDRDAGNAEVRRAIDDHWKALMADDEDGFGWSPTIYDFVMRTGPFAGQNPLELCREAIVFWKEYLDAIDRETA